MVLSSKILVSKRFYSLQSAANGGAGGSSNGGSTAGQTSSGQAAASSQSKPNIGAIIGGVIAALVVIVMAVLYYLTWRRKARRNTPQPDAEAPPRVARVRANYVVEPFTSGTSTESPTSAAAGEAVRYTSEKTMDVAWNNPGQSRVSLLNPNGSESQHSPYDSEAETTSASDHLPTTRERLLEERLAQLEAHVAGQLPPPYVTV
ncbi:hypothetical protein B0H10DRAFT_2209496 [Mycena sp. CBHHK59/15]|nr:hypothetical protein B0H10DRAFT_2209496 [Mycena sp. CBHHK59/15]